MTIKVELDEQTAAVVQELAAREQRSASEVIHDAQSVDTGQRKRRLPRSVGKYHSGQLGLAQRDEENLRQAVQDGLWP